MMKVEYRTRGGGVSTAYAEWLTEEVAKGTDKYTDDPVDLEWTGAEWREMES